MRENIKISSYVGIAFLVAFGTLFLFFIMYDEGLLTNMDIQEVKIGVNNKIFLLGTSYVGAINADHVQNVLDENGFSTSVLNPTNKLISQTVEIVDDIISNNPKLIVYGIGFRDIGFTDYGFCKLSQIPSYNLSKYALQPDVSDTPDKEKLLASKMTEEEMRDFIGVNSLKFVSLNGLYRAVGEKSGRNKKCPQYCDACFSGQYPILPLDKISEGFSVKKIVL